MSSIQTPGKDISPPEVTHISTHGVWLLTSDRELFMSYDDFPWFKEMPFGKIINIQEVSPGHFYWPDLDADLGIESIILPERFPLKARTESFYVAGKMDLTQ